MCMKIGLFQSFNVPPRHQIEKEGMTNLKKHKELKHDISQTLDFDDVYIIKVAGFDFQEKVRHDRVRKLVLTWGPHLRKETYVDDTMLHVILILYPPFWV